MDADEVIIQVITGLVSFIVGLALRWFEPKVDLAYWSPHFFVFRIPLPQNQASTPEPQTQQVAETQSASGLPQQAQLQTHAITIQNFGRRSAEQVEIVHRRRPDFFQLYPVLPFSESATPSGEHILSINSLGPKEWFTVEFLTYTANPELLVIRSKAGQGRVISIRLNRQWPKWVNALAWVLVITGFAFWVYVAVRLSYRAISRA